MCHQQGQLQVQATQALAQSNTFLGCRIFCLFGEVCRTVGPFCCCCLFTFLSELKKVLGGNLNNRVYANSRKRFIVFLFQERQYPILPSELFLLEPALVSRQRVVISILTSRYIIYQMPKKTSLALVSCLDLYLFCQQIYKRKFIKM